MTERSAPLILYVEDERVILELGIAALEDGGFRVEAAQSGADAVDRLETPDDVIRGLITDIDLGGGVDGWFVAWRARELFPDMPVIYVSGGSADQWGSRGVPGSLMVPKPYALAQLVAAVSTATLGPHQGFESSG